MRIVGVISGIIVLVAFLVFLLRGLKLSSFLMKQNLRYDDDEEDE